MAEGYAVIGQRPYRDVLADGRVGEVVEVTFQTSSGITGSVVVPVGDFQPDVVQAMIEQKVRLIAAVNRIEGVVEAE